jgi:hypothetical protein
MIEGHKRDANTPPHSCVEYLSDALQPTEGGLSGRRFGQSMNTCKDFLSFLLFVMCFGIMCSFFVFHVMFTRYLIRE